MTPDVDFESDVLSSEEAGAELRALLGGAGISPLRDTGWIRVTGEDRVRWLNGMVTNSVTQLQPGEGAYNFLLNVQGRIQGDAVVFAEADALWMETAAEQVAGTMALLDRFIIMDDVVLENVSGARSGWLVVGTDAVAVLGAIGVEVAGLGELAMRRVMWNGVNVDVVHGYGPLAPRFELWVSVEGDAAARLGDALRGAGAVACGVESLEWVRVLEGTPRYGVDIRDKDLPQETGQTRALHFAKGCYLGQEIVERIRSRGNVHRGFCGFRLEGDVPAAGAVLEAEGKAVGELTSVAEVPLAEGVVGIALGYVRREALERGVELRYAGGVAVPVALPFVRAAAPGRGAASEPSE